MNDNEIDKKPRINLPIYGDDDEDDVTTATVDRYANIPTGEVDLETKTQPKTPPVKNAKNHAQFQRNRNNPQLQQKQQQKQQQPQNLAAVKAFNTMQSQRKQVVYEEDPF